MQESKSQDNNDKKNINKELNKHFYQFNTEVTPELLYKLADKPLSIKVLAVILYSANELGAVVIKQEYIRKAVAKRAKEANRSSVASAIHYLRALGVLAVSKKDSRNAYIINPKFIWRLQKSKRIYIVNSIKNHHIRFDANINEIRRVDDYKIKHKLVNARYNAQPLITRDLSRLKPSKPVESYYKDENIQSLVKQKLNTKHNHTKTSISKKPTQIPVNLVKFKSKK